MTQTDIAARLAAAGLRVKPLVWRVSHLNNGHVMSMAYDLIMTPLGWHLMDGSGQWATLVEAKAACELHHVESVLAMLEPIPSEEIKP